MPVIWGDIRITWRQVVPPVLILAAIVCLFLALRGCLPSRPESIPRHQLAAQYLARLDSDNPTLVAEAIRILGGLGDPSVVGAIRMKLGSPAPEVVGAACAALGKLGDQEAAGRILPLLSSPNSAIAAGAAEGLGHLRYGAALPGLVSVLGRPDPATRLAAIVALGNIGGPAAKEAIEKVQQDPCAGLSPPPAPEDRARLEEAVRAALEKLSGAR